MNALASIILPNMLIRQAHSALMPGAQPANTGTATTAHAPTELRATALNASLDVERRDLAPLLKLVAWIFQPMAERKQITLRLDAPDLGLYATCQEIRVQRVLESLLANALRHSPEGSQVTLAARNEDGWLCVWVEDQGPGVAPAEQARLFTESDDSFGEMVCGSVEDSRGLVACKEIVNAHGGEILMHNRAEGGAHFEFRLPAKPRRGNTTPPHPGKVSSFTSSSKPGLVRLTFPVRVA